MVGPLLRRMWEVLKLERTVITEGSLGADQQTIDAQIPMIRHGQAIRNVAFGRCQWVFAAHPETFVAAYTDWVKENLAGKEVYTVVEGGLGKTTMFSSGPLIHCLLGAQNVASLSAKRCDELIIRALKCYPGGGVAGGTSGAAVRQRQGALGAGTGRRTEGRGATRSLAGRGGRGVGAVTGEGAPHLSDSVETGVPLPTIYHFLHGREPSAFAGRSWGVPKQNSVSKFHANAALIVGRQLQPNAEF